MTLQAQGDGGLPVNEQIGELSILAMVGVWNVAGPVPCL